jgi:hypothetical protein
MRIGTICAGLWSKNTVEADILAEELSKFPEHYDMDLIREINGLLARGVRILKQPVAPGPNPPGRSLVKASG